MGVKFLRQNDRRFGTGSGAVEGTRVEGNGIADGSDVKRDLPRQIAQEQLIPRIIERSRNAVDVDRVLFYFYHRKHAGRRCSCWEVETPDAGCRVCYGTGIVGGYTKNGTVDHTVDVTHPNMRLVNVVPDYEGHTRPVTFTLNRTATRGYVEGSFDLQQNVGILDAYQQIQVTPEGSIIFPFIKSDQDADFVELNKDSIEARIQHSNVTVRFVLQRTNPTAPRPKFSHFMLRYRVKKKIAIRADIPRQPESITLAEFGAYESFQSIQIFTANEPRKITTEDFVHRVDNGRRHKIIEANPNMPLGRLTSHDLTARLIQRFESTMLVP
ncbi:MAG TPA: hypothetical protein EYQ00_01925 [Dehalococcoidia bacterium]|nr:hypothetical protein [Dehalococcoidia bacterium]